MEQKKACLSALVKGCVALFFLLWMLFMPLNGGDGLLSMIEYHILSVRSIASIGSADGIGAVTPIFAAAFLILWIVFFIRTAINMAYAGKRVKHPEKADAKKLKKACGFSDAIVLFVFFLLAYAFVLQLFLQFAVNYLFIAVLFIAFIAVIAFGAAAKHKIKKAFAAAGQAPGAEAADRQQNPSA